MRCLLIEDDPSTARLIQEALTGSGHTVLACGGADSGRERAEQEQWDVIVLDRLLPHSHDGLELLADLRAHGDHTPVLVLSALASLDERIRGLRAGGDDYLTKPFALDELLARLEALTRRATRETESDQLGIADLRLDLRTRKAFRSDKPLALQPREFRLLEYLVRNQGKVVTRSMLLESVWDYHFDPQTNVIDVQISRLRNKVDKDFAPALIHTVRGVGFMLQAPEDATSRA
ncbi:response regulator transcription factor [Azonexus sp.]|jgi:two-component system OmpR family response regulator|uniref:response regulator transcription factor n=1 Tax=Azonexus sp. TaxID=1872668 RepID=UPI0028374BBC|nr:response regulator transcription factor [Azonexus sp.]MDR1994799.1 response regulator transcription factor [Azonexus sp.]